MQQAALLSPSDRATLETSLGRLIANAYGVMATLPLYCLGQLHATDPDSMVRDCYDVWHSYLVVAREMIRSTSWRDEIIPILDVISGEIDDLRDSFLKLLRGKSLSPSEARSAYENLIGAYRRLAANVGEIVTELDLESSVLPDEKSVRKVTFERSLACFGKELGVTDQ